MKTTPARAPAPTEKIPHAVIPPSPGRVFRTTGVAATAALAASVVLLFSGSALAIGSAAILSHAADYAQHTWVMSVKNQKGSCTSSYKSDYTPGAQKGVPYDWGGFDTVAEFDQKIADGYGAGSHSWHGILSCTTGVDCSGFVSRCWELSEKYSTSTIGEVSHSIAKKDLVSGDAFNKKGSHIVLWVGTAGDGGPIFYEASGSASKVRLNSSASWSYLNGYSPIRYNGFTVESAPGMTNGTVSNPIVISTFPSHHEADSTQSASDVFDSYSCAAGTGEKGPEVVYKVQVPSNGTLTAAVSDGTAVDVDVHLLKSAASNACIARGDNKVTATVAAGTYWLVVDSWSDASGISYGGKYSLDLTLSTEAPPAPPGAGTFQNPILIEAFPYHDDRTTSGAASDVADSYTCAPEKGETGPEVVYRFTVTVPGTVTVSVVDKTGVDIDLHLLWAADPAACLVRADKKIVQAIDPGTYWLVADSWSDSSGKQYAGAYALDVGFSSTTPCTPACAGKQCGWNGCWGWCGVCKSGHLCQDGLCVASDSCGDGICEPAAGEKCNTCFPDCPCGCGQTCISGLCTLTVCIGRGCGPDGCGGYCGQCAETEYCDKGVCTPLAGTLPKVITCEGDECESPENEGDRSPPPGWDDVEGDGNGSFVVEGEQSSSSGGGCNAGGRPASLLMLLLALGLLPAMRRRSQVRAE